MSKRTSENKPTEKQKKHPKKVNAKLRLKVKHLAQLYFAPVDACTALAPYLLQYLDLQYRGNPIFENNYEEKTILTAEVRERIKEHLFGEEGCKHCCAIAASFQAGRNALVARISNKESHPINKHAIGYC